MRLPPGASILMVLVCWCAAAVQLQAATLSTFDGQIQVGHDLTFSLTGGEQLVHIADKTIPLGNCDWLEPGDGAGIVLPANIAYNLWLDDGSWLPVTKLVASANDNFLEVEGPLGRMTLPLASLRGWSGGAELPPASDGQSDSVQLESGVNQLHIDGLVGGKLQMHSDLEPDKKLDVPLEQVKALRLAVSTHPPAPLGLRLVLSDQHAAIQLVIRKGADNQLGICLAAAPQVEAGAAVLHARLRTEGGRRVYLSTFDPAKQDEEGAFGVVWHWKRDANIDGSPLMLGGVHYDRGIVVHSKATLGWKLGHAYVRFHALAGIADSFADQGDCEASLVADGKVLWHRDSVKGHDKPIVLDLDLSGVDQLELHVDYGARYDIGDHFVLADSYLVKAAEPAK